MAFQLSPMSSIPSQRFYKKANTTPSKSPTSPLSSHSEFSPSPSPSSTSSRDHDESNGGHNLEHVHRVHARHPVSSLSFAEEGASPQYAVKFEAISSASTNGGGSGNASSRSGTGHHAMDMDVEELVQHNHEEVEEDEEEEEEEDQHQQHEDALHHKNSFVSAQPPSSSASSSSHGAPKQPLPHPPLHPASEVTSSPNSPYVWAGPPCHQPEHAPATPQEEVAFEAHSIKFFKQLSIAGLVISVDDFVYLKAGEGQKPFIAQVRAFFEDTMYGTKMLTVSWFYRPEETKQGRQPQHGIMEVCCTSHKYSSESVTCIDGICTVLDFDAYCRYRAVEKRNALLGIPADPNAQHVYFTRDPPFVLRRPPRRHKRRRSPTEGAGEAGTAAPHEPVTKASFFKRFDEKINKRNGKGETQLHVAAMKGNAELTRELLDKGAAPNIPDFAGWTPLHEAASAGHTKVVKLLLEYGADHSSIGPEGITPLHDAAENGFGDIVTMLIRAGAAVDAKDHENETPLDKCANDEVRRIFAETRCTRRAAATAARETQRIMAAYML